MASTPDARFEQLRTGQEHITLMTCYHWRDPEHQGEFNTREFKQDQILHVCDDYFSWAHRESRLYKLDVAFREPLVLLEQLPDYEEIFTEDSLGNGDNAFWSLVLDGGFDSIVYTPHPYGRGVRQAALMQAWQQVLNVTEIPVDTLDWNWIETMRGQMNAQWRFIVQGLHPECPYTVQQLAELEGRLMAYRYAYYVEASPLVTDSDYDRLDEKVLPWLPKRSPLHLPGSDWSGAYASEHVAYAAHLRSHPPPAYP